MPEHIVVRCYSCQSFQAQQLRKTNDFVCKMCGAKQSVRKIYARSFKAADIRPIVQEYNMKRGEIEEDEAHNNVVQVELRAQQRMQSTEHVTEGAPSNTARSNEWEQFLEEENEHDTRQNETGAELMTALPEFNKRTSKSGNAVSAPNTNKWSAQPKRSVVTGVKRKWTPSESRDSYESAPKYARHESTARHVSNEAPRLISTAHLVRSAGSSTNQALTPVKQQTTPPVREASQQHVIDKIRAVTAYRTQSTSATASVGHVPHTANSAAVHSPPVPTINSAVNNNQKRKSEWDDFIDDEPTEHDTCQDQDGGELLFAADDGLQAVTDEW